MSAGNRPAAGLRQLWRQSLTYLQPYRRHMAVVLLTFIIDIAFKLTFYYSTKVLTDDALAHRTMGVVVPVFVGLAAFFIVSIGADLARDFLLVDVEVQFGENLRLALLKQFHRLSVDFYARAQIGDLVTRFTSDVAIIKAAVTGALPTVVHRVLQVAACFLFLFTFDWRLAIVTAVVLPLAVPLPRYFVARSLRANSDQAHVDTGIAAEIQEQLSGHNVIRAFGLGQLMVRSMERRFADAGPRSAGASRLNRLVRTTSGAGITFTTSLLTAIGVILVFQGILTVGSLVGFVGILNLLSQASSRLADTFPAWLNASGAMQRIEELFAERPTVIDTAEAIPTSGVSGMIRFDNVSFGYVPNEKTVQNISFQLRAGDSAAFVGRSGSGKSTVIALLMRLHDPQEGEIALDGRNIRSISLESFRASIGVVFQESFLFDRSIRDNIRLGWPEATNVEVEDAARAAQIHDVIASLPHGYDTRVGERGGLLSGGQRQRIALARALLRDPAILVLDEATSSLDPASEAAFNETLRALSRGRTVISVTHRLSTPVGADFIGVLDRGRLVEQGTHEELLHLGGVYRDLWEQQRGFAVSEDGWTASVDPHRLRQIPLFAPAPDEALQALSRHFTSRHFDSGDIVIQQGDAADTFYILVRGRLHVYVSDADAHDRLVDVLDDGQFFGEIGLLRDAPRTASVVASEPSLVLVLTRLQFQKLMVTVPELGDLVEQAAVERMERVEGAHRVGVSRTARAYEHESSLDSESIV